MAHELDRWRVKPGKRPDLDGIDTRSTDGAPGDKETTKLVTKGLVAELAEGQNRLWAEGERSVLLVLQALDAGGKDGTIRKVFSGVNPQGVRVASFKVPSTKERSHDFLWRIHAQVPARGEIGIFNRSHYEDVLVARVDELVPEKVWRKRYKAIRDFEEMLVDSGTTVLKIYLHISPDEQKERFQDRLDDPQKRWKFSAGDLKVRENWGAYREAYLDAIEETSTEEAPWFVVPADRKWYRDWTVMQILLGTFDRLDPQFPEEEPGLDGLVIS